MPGWKKKRRSSAGGTVSSWSRSDVGRKREKNEDSYLVDPSMMLYVVADGMGGHAGGATASRMAVQTVHGVVRAALQAGDAFPVEPPNGEHAPLLEVLDAAVREASKRIHETSIRDPKLHGMGTTATLTMFLGSRIYVAHVGDSRLYRLRKGVFEQLTEDHSLVAEQVKAGFITSEEAQFSRFRNIITRSVGFEAQVTADTFSVAVQLGDVFIICSDGLTGMVSDEQIHAELGGQRLQNAASNLISQANRAGGDDNITLVLMRYKGELGKSVARTHRRGARKRKKAGRKD